MYFSISSWMVSRHAASLVLICSTTLLKLSVGLAWYRSLSCKRLIRGEAECFWSASLRKKTAPEWASVMQPVIKSFEGSTWLLFFSFMSVHSCTFFFFLYLLCFSNFIHGSIRYHQLLVTSLNFKHYVLCSVPINLFLSHYYICYSMALSMAKLKTRHRNLKSC